MPPPRIPDPRAVPVVGTDAHLPVIPPGELTAAALRQRFASGVGWHPEFTGDGRIVAVREPSQAAVLVPLIDRHDGLHVLLTQRAENMRSHPGQISFPGGRVEAADADAAATALREAREEIGLASERVEIIGRMPTYTTVTSFVVTPVVGLIGTPFDLAELRLDATEVAAAFEVPLAFLMNPAHHQRHVMDYEGGQRQFLSMPWRDRAHGAAQDEVYIWGATAAMLRNLYRFLAG